MLLAWSWVYNSMRPSVENYHNWDSLILLQDYLNSRVGIEVEMSDSDSRPKISDSDSGGFLNVWFRFRFQSKLEMFDSDSNSDSSQNWNHSGINSDSGIGIVHHWCTLMTLASVAWEPPLYWHYYNLIICRESSQIRCLIFDSALPRKIWTEKYHICHILSFCGILQISSVHLAYNGT